MPRIDLTIKDKEAKTLTFTVTDAAGDPVNLTGATLTFAIKEDIEDAEAVVTKADGTFGKANQVLGIVTVDLSADETHRTGLHAGDLKIEFSASDIDKSIPSWRIMFAPAATV